MKTVTISKEEYEDLIALKRVVAKGYEKKFSKNFIKDIKQAEKDYKEGRFVRVKNSADRKKIFDSL